MPEHTLHEAAGGASSSTTATIPFADRIFAPESPLTRETVRGAERRFEGRHHGRRLAQAKERSTFRVNRPMLVVVLNACVTETNDT
jgi:hypothetical protein